MLTIRMEDIRHLQRSLERERGVNSLDPNDWWVHAQSTRDLADRMLVRGDTKGAEAMLFAAVELEKRHNAAIAIMPFSIGRDAVNSCYDSQSSLGSAAPSWATPIDGRIRKGAADESPPRNTNGWDPEMPSEPSQAIRDVPVTAFADFSPTRGVSVEPLLSNSLAEFPSSPISPEPLYRMWFRRGFLLGWTASVSARFRSVVEIALQ
jgi:hypothetical protein